MCCSALFGIARSILPFVLETSEIPNHDGFLSSDAPARRSLRPDTERSNTGFAKSEPGIPNRDFRERDLERLTNQPLIVPGYARAVYDDEKRDLLRNHFDGRNSKIAFSFHYVVRISNASAATHRLRQIQRERRRYRPHLERVRIRLPSANRRN